MMEEAMTGQEGALGITMTMGVGVIAIVVAVTVAVAGGQIQMVIIKVGAVEKVQVIITTEGREMINTIVMMMTMMMNMIMRRMKTQKMTEMNKGITREAVVAAAAAAATLVVGRMMVPQIIEANKTEIKQMEVKLTRVVPVVRTTVVAMETVSSVETGEATMEERIRAERTNLEPGMIMGIRVAKTKVIGGAAIMAKGTQVGMGGTKEEAVMIEVKEIPMEAVEIRAKVMVMEMITAKALMALVINMAAMEIPMAAMVGIMEKEETTETILVVQVLEILTELMMHMEQAMEVAGTMEVGQEVTMDSTAAVVGAAKDLEEANLRMVMVGAIVLIMEE